MQVTITRFTTEGDHKGNCLFAGLAFYQGLKENILFCSNRSLWSTNITGTSKGTGHVIPPFIDMSVVLYSFPNYASVSVSLIFTLSTCTGVAINPCEYEAYCGGKSINVLVCKRYLSSLRTVNAQFILNVQTIKWFQSLHTIRFLNRKGLLLKQKGGSCLQIYVSSSVQAREDNISEDIYYHYFLQGEDEPVTATATCKNCGSRCILCNKFNEKEKDWERDPCKGCGKRQTIFRGPDTKNLFCKWLIAKEHRNVTCIAHNARGYDSYFIYDYLIANSHVPDPVIFSGSKIMYMNVPTDGINIRLLDSLNFLPMPLAQLPKSFGLSELKKRFFPHYYNTPEHQNDVLLNLPDIKYYDPDSISKGRREEFFK